MLRALQYSCSSPVVGAPGIAACRRAGVAVMLEFDLVPTSFNRSSRMQPQHRRLSFDFDNGPPRPPRSTKANVSARRWSRHCPGTSLVISPMAGESSSRLIAKLQMGVDTSRPAGSSYGIAVSYFPEVGALVAQSTPGTGNPTVGESVAVVVAGDPVPGVVLAIFGSSTQASDTAYSFIVGFLEQTSSAPFDSRRSLEGASIQPLRTTCSATNRLLGQTCPKFLSVPPNELPNQSEMQHLCRAISVADVVQRCIYPRGDPIGQHSLNWLWSGRKLVGPSPNPRLAASSSRLRAQVVTGFPMIDLLYPISVSQRVTLRNNLIKPCELSKYLERIALTQALSSCAHRPKILWVELSNGSNDTTSTQMLRRRLRQQQALDFRLGKIEASRRPDVTFVYPSKFDSGTLFELLLTPSAAREVLLEMIDAAGAPEPSSGGSATIQKSEFDETDAEVSENILVFVQGIGCFIENAFRILSHYESTEPWITMLFRPKMITALIQLLSCNGYYFRRTSERKTEISVTLILTDSHAESVVQNHFLPMKQDVHPFSLTDISKYPAAGFCLRPQREAAAPPIGRSVYTPTVKQAKEAIEELLGQGIGIPLLFPIGTRDMEFHTHFTCSLLEQIRKDFLRMVARYYDEVNSQNEKESFGIFVDIWNKEDLNTYHTMFAFATMHLREIPDNNLFGGGYSMEEYLAEQAVILRAATLGTSCLSEEIPSEKFEHLQSLLLHKLKCEKPRDLNEHPHSDSFSWVQILRCFKMGAEIETARNLLKKLDLEIMNFWKIGSRASSRQ